MCILTMSQPGYAISIFSNLSMPRNIPIFLVTVYPFIHFVILISALIALEACRELIC